MEGKVTGKISICVEGIENEEGYIDIRDFSRFFYYIKVYTTYFILDDEIKNIIRQKMQNKDNPNLEAKIRELLPEIKSIEERRSREDFGKYRDKLNDYFHNEEIFLYVENVEKGSLKTVLLAVHILLATYPYISPVVSTACIIALEKTGHHVKEFEIDTNLGLPEKLSIEQKIRIVVEKNKNEKK